jgi:SAM-dependent methyltransferase
VADDEVRLRRRNSFDDDPDIYRSARPDYPARVYEVLADRCGLRAGTRVLEIGPGTGQATRRLVAAGAWIVAVELGAGLAARLREDTAGQNVVVTEGDFTTVSLPAGGFDMAVAATAFHWLDPATAVRRLATAVRPGGWLAVWWTVFGDPHDIPAWRLALDAVYERHLPGERRDLAEVPAPMRVAARGAELAAGGWFGPVQAEMIRWQHRLTPEVARRLWATFPNVRELDAVRRAAFLNELSDVVGSQPGGVAVDNYVTALYTAQRRISDEPADLRNHTAPATRPGPPPHGSG